MYYRDLDSGLVLVIVEKECILTLRRSKLGNILFTKELAKRLEKRGSDKVYANCFFPGK